MIGILGKKIGMTQVFTEDGSLVGVTVIEAGPCPILEIKAKSIKVGFDPAKEARVNKPMAGYFKKANVSACKVLKELPKEEGKEFKVGENLKVDLFKAGDIVDVIGTSIGKGFQGGMKRWHWHGGPMTHGSMSHRRVGSIGSTTTPGRVWKGHHMPGHMGNHRTTLQNLEVVKIYPQENLLLVKGTVPGHKNSYLVIRSAKKIRKKAVQPKTKTPAKAAKK